VTEAPATRPSGTRSPKAIAHYAIRGRLGKGAMGVVYHAVDERTGQPVALKVIASDLESEDEIRARFFREAVVAGQLRHRNIVSVLDSGEDEGRLYLAMELLTGATLGEFLRQPESADLELRVDFMIQVCQGLTIAHEAGVYHRDIKPGNLFVSSDHRVKILDFGVARLAGSNMTVTGYVLGTPDFMSPEQARGQDVDERSDIFSAGAVFYLMLTGRKPFAAADLPAVLTKVLRENPPPVHPDEAPAQLAAVVQKALEKSPAARHQNMAELTSDLMRAADAIASRTLRRAADVRQEAELLRHLEGLANDRRRALGMPTSEWSDWQQITDRYPMLRRGPGVLGVFPLRSSVVEAVASEVSGRLPALRKEVDVLEEAHAEWSRGRAMLAAGHDVEAATHLAAARRLVPESPVITRAIEACAEAAEARRDLQARLTSRLQAAEQAAARRDWEAVMLVAAEIDEFSPGSAEAQRLRRVASENLDADRRQRIREQASQMAAGVLAEVRGLTEQGRFDEAVARLQAHLLTHPDAPGVAEAVEATRRQQAEAAARDQRRAESARCAAEARRAFEGGDLNSAEDAAAKALELSADQIGVAALLDDIRSSIAERDARDARARRLADLIERAERLRESGKLGSALSVLDDVQEIEPDDERARALRLRVIGQIQAQRQQAEAAALIERQQRAAAPAIREARRALADGDFRRARSLAEVARAHGPELPEVLALLAAIDARTPPPSDDDTERITPADGNEETAKLTPVQTSWRDTADQLRDRAAAIVRRWQRPQG
jgi:serine/threonine-protein kinase